MATEYVLWGYKPHLPLPLPIRLTGGNLRDCRAEQRQHEADPRGWQTAIYAKGTPPTGLRLIVAEQNGVTLDEALAHLS